MPWVTLTDAGFTPYADYLISGSGNFYLSGSSLVSSGGVGSSDNYVTLSIPDITPYDVGGIFSLRLTAISFSAPSGGDTFAFTRDPFGAADAFPNASGTPNAAYAPSPLVLEYPVSGASGFADFSTTGPTDDSVTAEFLIEIFVAEEPTPGGRSLTKSSALTVLTPAIPPQAAVAPVPFHMYAPPLPIGWRYKPYTTDGLTELPNSAATFNAWPTQIYQPQIYAPSPGGAANWVFMSVAEFAEYLASLGVSSISYDQAFPVLNEFNELTGYRVYVVTEGTPVLQPPVWWAPIAHMTLVTFPDVATTGPHGYPSGTGTLRGYVDIPTLDGVQRVWGNYFKDHRGVLLRNPQTSDPLPPYCSLRDSVTYNPARVVVLADFPGRAAVNGTPAVLVLDGNPGWNAGATSAETHDGDCRVTFTPYVEAAVTLGLTRSPRPSVANPADVEFGFRFEAPAGGQVRCYVTENGNRMTPQWQVAADAVFAIERVAGAVTYKINDVEVYASQRFSAGALCVGACLFYGGDGVY